MGMLKGLLHRRHEAGDHEEADGPAWQALPDLDLRGVSMFDETLDWAEPAPCPSCGATGYMDRIDIERRVTSQHCPWCWTKWEVSAADG